jgi:hypothetical protein
MFRRSVLLTTFLCGMIVASCHVAGAGKVTPLSEQLVNGLRATRPDETAFIHRVVTFVEAERLALSTVNAAFKWARKRNPNYPYPYFERAMRILAAREGVQL